MGGRTLVVILGIAAGAMLAGVRPVDAPELQLEKPEYVRDHKIIPVPIMGIRGAAEVLAVPPGV